MAFIFLSVHLFPISSLAQETFDSSSAEKGVDAVLLVDNSGTMRLSDPNRLRDEGVRLFLQFLNSDDRVAVIEFDDSSRLLQELSAYNQLLGAKVVEKIRQGTLDGYYTDIREAVRYSCELLASSGREDAARSIILLSDGKMESNPDKGTTEALTVQLFYEVLPYCEEQGVKVHTVTFSEEADTDILRKIAELSGGVNWFAPSVEKIHQSFAELLLVLKKPQIVPLTKRGFSIDEGVDEATFYLNNEEISGEVALRTPSGDILKAEEVPDSIRWFSSERFEVITIENPEKGDWQILGVSSEESFATVLTKLKLLSDWPQSIVAGDEVLLQARLQEDERPVVLPEMTEVMEIAFQVTPTDKIAEPIIREFLVDDGQHGDMKVNDGIFSRMIRIDEPGEYKIDIVAKSPTFQRNQRIPFRVRERLIGLSLEQIEVNSLELSELVSGEIFVVDLSEEVSLMQSIDVQLFAVDEKRRRYQLSLTQSPTNTRRYEASVSELPFNGTYQLQATVNAEDRRRKKIKGTSTKLTYVKQSKEIDVADDYVVVHKEKLPEKPASPIIPIILGLFLQSGAGVFYFLKIKKQQDLASVTIPPYSPSDELSEALSSIETRSKLSSIEANDPILSDDYEYVEPLLSSNLNKLLSENETTSGEQEGAASDEEEANDSAEGPEEEEEEAHETEDEQYEDDEEAESDEGDNDEERES